MSRRLSLLPDILTASYRRFSTTGPIVLAVSGGADSMSLLCGTLAIASDLELQPIVAHFDHGLRPDSNDDVEWLALRTKTLGVEFVTGRGDVPAFASEQRIGLEEAARRLRYDFLVRTAEQTGAATIATAHTADDLAETVLFHVLRGTGLRGLKGIPPRRRVSERLTLIRPMLEVTRAEAERFVLNAGQSFLQDPTNTDPSFTRNRMRHELLPMLRETVNPQVELALRRLATQARETAVIVHRLARAEVRHALIDSSPEAMRLRIRRLKTRPRPIIRETVALAWRRAQWPRQSMGFEHWDALADLVIAGGRRTLPGGTDARRRQGELILRRRPP